MESKQHKAEAKPVEPAKPAVAKVDPPPPPPPKKYPPPKQVADDIVYIEHKKIYHAQFRAGGTSISVGNFDTLEDAKRALNKAKSDLNM